MKRAGNNPKRRVAAQDSLTVDQRSALAKRIIYAASGHHKRNPADYGLERVNPRPTKSLCDKVRVIPLKEAREMISKGVSLAVVSDYSFGEFPKYIWCVAEDGEVYEAKTDATKAGTYHGYRLEEEDDVRDYIKGIWKERCHPVGR